MAALSTQYVGAGGAYTTAAAAAGGDTAEAGMAAGGWREGPNLYVVVGATSTTVTVGGVAFGPYSNQTAVIPVNNTYQGSRIPITYNQVTGVTVAVVSAGSAPTGVTWGT